MEYKVTKSSTQNAKITPRPLELASNQNAKTTQSQLSRVRTRLTQTVQFLVSFLIPPRTLSRYFAQAPWEVRIRVTTKRVKREGIV